jgi:NAD(P)-dependent dehydrogenase (short-subunit alcohol dehydrogenase family)
MPLPRVVLVTGANTGIGYEIVKAFLESARAYHVLLGSRDFDKGKEAVAALQSEVETSMNTAEAIQLDLTSDASIESAFETVNSTLGRLDYLINNAGKIRCTIFWWH